MTATAYNWVDQANNQIIDGSGNSLIFYSVQIAELSASATVSNFNDNSVSVTTYKNNSISAQKYNNINIGVS